MTNPRTALLLVNTGSPAAPTPNAVKKYPTEFLSDRRVVDLPPWLWQPILRCHILPRRSKASAARYGKVWTRDGSPLVSNTARIAERLQEMLGYSLSVRWAMCYGTSRIDEVLPEILAERPDRLVVLPLLTWLILKNLVSDRFLVSCAVILNAMPVASVVAMVAGTIEGMEKKTSVIVALTTILSMGTIPVIALVTGIV